MDQLRNMVLVRGGRFYSAPPPFLEQAYGQIFVVTVKDSFLKNDDGRVIFLPQKNSHGFNKNVCYSNYLKAQLKGIVQPLKRKVMSVINR
jgi:hypothetical protein